VDDKTDLYWIRQRGLAEQGRDELGFLTMDTLEAWAIKTDRSPLEILADLTEWYAMVGASWKGWRAAVQEELDEAEKDE